MMKKIKFTKISPSENMTILVENPIPISKQSVIAEKIMNYNHIGGEQVGFLMPTKDSRADYGMRMMGGEFCGNATLSLGAWAMFKEDFNASVGYMKHYLLEISGADRLVSCTIEKKKNGYSGTVEMPLPISITEQVFRYRTKDYTLPVVEFKGISHIIFDENSLGEASEIAIEDMAELWAEKMPSAFGIILWRFDEEEEIDYIKPYVTVDNHGVWERSCASGVASVSAYIANLEKENYLGEFHFVDNPNKISVQVAADKDDIYFISLEGHINIVATGIGIIE